MRFLGIDYGVKKIGLAVSDPSGRVAFPESVIANDHKMFDRIKDLCLERGVEKIVIGWPLKMLGGVNEEVAVGARALADNLAAMGLPVDWCDERLTSREARHARRAAAGRRDGNDDARAAAVMLLRYLDRANQQH